MIKVIRDILVFIVAICFVVTLWAFAILYTFQQTIENPDFHISILKNFDISQLIYDTVESEISKKIGQDFPSEIPESARKLVKAKIREIFEENIQDSTYAFYDYLSGKSETLDINIDTKEVKRELKPLALKILLESQSEEIRNKFSDRMEREFNLLWDKMIVQVPDSINGEMILVELNKANIINKLQKWSEIRKLINQVYYLSIVLIIVLILFIVLLQWNHKKSLLLIGTLFLLSGGILILPLLFFNSHLILGVLSDSLFPQLKSQNIPAFMIILVKNIIDGLIYHTGAALIGYILIGFTSIIASYILKRSQNIRNQKRISKH
ncbi:MAG: hypothetical protein JXR70_19015 [Spirochaetales bacterium]|nr:hypothetical protein [Spirochaetales bacterium]